MSSSGFMAFEMSSKAHSHRAMGQGLVRVYSPMVTVGGHCWRLACYPYGDAPRVPAITRFASIYLELVSRPTHAVTATFDAFAVSPPSHHNQCVHVYSPDHCNVELWSSSPISLEDIEPEIFGAMLRFIYTETLPDNADGEPPNIEVLGRFLAAADRFALDGLKLECTHRLLTTVSVDSVVDMLRLAETHSCAELKARCIGFIAMIQNFKDVALTGGFVQLAVESPTILAELRERTDYFA
ncbi:BTB/POZ and MATH domain-containing protein 1-like [Aegilops tauschii subsp. strangulata]|uniref:BTB/POZ and MATH domain-containing protein 1-like n=1 Tax=Aegilops tauschii subsp. strangulata TaxID=200361 RepID=UPI003CC83A61